MRSFFEAVAGAGFHAIAKSDNSPYAGMADPARKLVVASNANWGGGATDPVAEQAREAFYKAVQQAVDDEAAPRLVPASSR